MADHCGRGLPLPFSPPTMALPALPPQTMAPLHVECERVEAADVFPNPLTRRALLAHRRLARGVYAGGTLPPGVAAINRLEVPVGTVPEALSHQDVSARLSRRQARLIQQAAFFRAVRRHPEFAVVPGFEVPKRLMRETIGLLNALRSVGNCLRRQPIHTMVGSREEADVASVCIGSLWPAGVDLYGVLRELYPPFHARVTGQVPECLAVEMDRLLDVPVAAGAVQGIGRYCIDQKGRFLGLYPVCRLPEEGLTLDAPRVSQDQLGRRALVDRILADILGIAETPGLTGVVVIDYAGGVGNMAELVLKKILLMPDSVVKSRLLALVRLVVIDVAEGQLAGGRERFRQRAAQPLYAGIEQRILFLKGDVTQPLSADHTAAMRATFGAGTLEQPVFLGMTSYTLGALDNLPLEQTPHVSGGATTVAEAMADAMFQTCSRVYAVDFSSPMWRLQGFLRDTGRWGQEYLRTVHGVSLPEEEGQAAHGLLAGWCRWRFGLRLGSVAEAVRLMSVGGAMAAHYASVWPGGDGHNAGYCIEEDGSLKKPAILGFAERLRNQGAAVHYSSKVWLFATIDLGRTGRAERAWGLIPGWMADFVVAENRPSTAGSPGGIGGLA